MHSALEALAAPAIMVAPFVLGFGQVATAIAVVLGVVLLGHTLQLAGPRRTVPLAAHAGFDYALAIAAVGAGLVVGIATAEWVAGVFLVGVGAGLVALAALTRFSAPLNA
jgi:hypothetical protein